MPPAVAAGMSAQGYGRGGFGLRDMLSDRRTLAAFGAILLLAVVLRWLAYSTFAIVHLDEVLQYQERAFRMVFGRGLIPWETRYGLRGALIPELLAAPMWLVSRVTGDFWAPLLAARAVFAALCLAVVPAAYAIGAQASRTHALAAMFAAAVWFESVLFGVQVLSESVAAAAGLAGAAATLRARDSRGAARLAGFLLTLTVLMRLQYAVFAGVLAVAALGRDRAAWRHLLVGALPALALGAATDLLAGTIPFAWIATNFGVNLHQGRAATFGVSPPWAYLQALPERMGPAAIAIVAGAIFSGARYRPLLLAALASLAAHSLIGHKEYRFVWLSVLAIVVLAAIASVDLAARLLKRRPGEPLGTAALAAVCTGWAALSALSFHQSGGMSAFRDEGGLASLVLRATQVPGSCAVAVPVKDRKAAAYVFMPRPLRLYLYPDAMNEGAERFGPAITDAADTLLITERAPPPLGYGRVACAMNWDRRACLYSRPGGCHNAAAAAAADYEYQTMLIRNDQ